MKAHRPRLRTVASICAFGAVAVAAALVFFLSRHESASATAGAPRPSTAAIAAIQQKYGVRFTMVGLTASGGLLDVRFIAVDADKVEQLGHHGTRMKLVAERSGKTLDSEQMTPHFGKIHVGSQYFALMRNDSDALHQGDLVTIKVGKLALQHMRVL
jgi:hypothetical protein